MPAEGELDYIGMYTMPQMLPVRLGPTSRESYPSPPTFDEEYFEWIDVLEAVQAARGSFTMLELGAGYGRWAVRGALAARRRDLRVRLGLAEAEPQHVLWLHEHAAHNGITRAEYEVYPAAVGAQVGSVMFYVGQPAIALDDIARDWYGQAVVPASKGADTAGAPEETYLGHPVKMLAGGWKGVEVPLLPLTNILDNYDFVDLADFDIQGAEAEVIAAALEPLGRKVRRLHIGTHSPQIDIDLARMLSAAGWHCLRAFGCLRWNRTPYGWINFGDGVQSWINPKLS